MNLFSEIKGTEQILVSVRYHADQVSGKIFINDVERDDALLVVTADISILAIGAWIDLVEVDGVDITDHVYDQLVYNQSIHIPGPFYHWWHRVSGQGWLLHPYFPG